MASGWEWLESFELFDADLSGSFGSKAALFPQMMSWERNERKMARPERFERPTLKFVV